MNHDQQTVLAAYDEAVKTLYLKLVDHYIEAAGDPQLEKEAGQHFGAGLEAARRSRDRAIALSGLNRTESAGPLPLP